MDCPQESMRLQKYLARAGVASRRACEAIILAGRVSVNGAVVTELGTKVVPERDTVEVDGKVVLLGDSQVILMLNKPKGYLTSMSDPFSRACVSDLIPTDRYPGIFPVGRLDRNTTGLLLFTTDGELGNKLLHPREHVDKTYHALVAGHVSSDALRQLESGVVLEDGITSPAKAEVIKKTKKNTWLSLTIHEGRKRQVRRMCDAVGFPVKELQRVSFGPLSLGDLKQGSYRELTAVECRELCGDK